MLSEKILKILQNPRYIGPAINLSVNRAYHTRLGRWEYNKNGIDIFEQDWDNLIILDACRYDALKRHCGALPTGELQSRISRGSHSSEWVRGNFDKQLHNTVYLSTNMFYPRLLNEGKIDSELHAFRAVQEEDNWKHRAENGLHPKQTTREAKNIFDEYPNKRLIIHYMKPHCPYIGKLGRDRFGPDDTPKLVYQSDRPEITPAVLQEAYEENLKIVIEHINKLLDYIDGKTVVSADHGELLGERTEPIPVKQWGHPKGTYVPELIKIPWYVIKKGSRKRITAEPPSKDDDSNKFDSNYIDNRLAALGYK